MQALADSADGYDAADLRVLVDRALHIAARRQLGTQQQQQHAAAPAGIGQQRSQLTTAGSSQPKSYQLAVTAADLAAAQQGFQPAAAWGVGHAGETHTFDCMARCHWLNIMHLLA